MNIAKQNDRWRWLTAGAVAVSLLAFATLIVLLAWQGFRAFWPQPVTLFTLHSAPGQLLGEVVSREHYDRQQQLLRGLSADGAHPVTRYVIKTGNRDFSDADFHSLLDGEIVRQQRPRAIMVLQRRSGGNAYGWFVELREGDQPLTAQNPQAMLQQRLQQVRLQRRQAENIRQVEMAKINAQLEALDDDAGQQRRAGRFNAEEQSIYAADQLALQRQFTLQAERLASLLNDSERDALILRDAQGVEHRIPLSQIVNAWYPNSMTLSQQLSHFFQQLWHFLSDSSGASQSEGGVFPAIFGTILMVLMMSIVVMPLGVVAAIWLHEYAGKNLITQLVRIAVVNLAGVPSIVYGVFGLGFFVWLVGGTLDQLFFAHNLPNPTFGTPGLLWASLTLALLTLPVVIVATEEGLSRIPASLRQGALALGATRAETLWQITLPMAVPAMLTGLILAVARAAGETAPLMLVGVVKMVPELPVDAVFPYLHLDRKFMHLGFQIYDLAFQSPNAEADRPLVYASALLLVTIIISLNLLAMALRHRLRERYRALTQ